MLLALLSAGHAAVADSNAQIAEGLIKQDVYISPPLQGTGHVRSGDEGLLKRVIASAARQGAPEKIALVSHYPTQYATPIEAATNLQNYLGFSGVLVLVSPRGLGIGSDYLSARQVQTVVRDVQPLCRVSYASCAAAAATRSIAYVQASQRSTHHSVLVFWGVTVAAFLVALGLLAAFTLARRRSAPGGAERMSEPRPDESLAESGS
jgi:hypothetical protein